MPKPFPILLNKSDSVCTGIRELVDSGVYQSINENSNERCYLVYCEDVLTIHLNREHEKLSVAIDFVGGKAKHRRQYGGGKNQPLAKSCGLDKHPDWAIFDATAGLGKDAFVLASLGAQITLCEQHPALYGLLVDAIFRAFNDEESRPLVEQMLCVHANAMTYLASGALKTKPDVIYLDPMYPDRKKSAKIKKEMQVLQSLVAHSGDETKLFDIALKTAKHRVVVKRPKTALPLTNKQVSYTVSSVNTRYDVYVVTKA